MSAAVYGKGRISAGVLDLTFQPRITMPGRRLVVLCHGYNENALAWADGASGTWPNHATFAHALAKAGFTMAAVDFSNTFGNATATALVDAIRSWCATNLGTDANKVNLVGFSMGNLTALGYLRDFAAHVGGIIGIAPASDLDDIRNNNRAGAQAAVDTAWGVGVPPAALPVGANPATNTAALAAVGVPYQTFYSTADPTVIPSTVTALTAAMEGTATSIGAIATHGDVDLAAVPVSSVASLLSSWGS